jgi:hypothetical protein
MRRAERNGELMVATVTCFWRLFFLHHSDHYWPMDTVPVYYGDIKVTLLNDSHYPDWIVTEFMMQRVRTSACVRAQHWHDFILRATFNVFSVISTSPHGQILACQIHRKRLRASWELSESASVQRRDRLLFTAALALADQEHSSHSTGSCNRSKLLTTSTSSALFTPWEKVRNMKRLSGDLIWQ